jgi:hypothetical protein
LSSVNISPAAIYRTIELFCPTLLIDEADQLFADRSKGELVGILNSGHARGETVIRTVGDDHEPRMFSTYCASAFASIGTLPDTIADRSITVRLDRRLPGERVEPFRLDRTAHLDTLARRIARWVADHSDSIAEADPDMPPGIRDREGDNWRPLLAIADAAGGEWHARARDAAVQGRNVAEDPGLLTMLLADIRAIFSGRENPDYLLSVELVAALIEIEGRPWAEYGRAGKPMSPNQLARILKRVPISPENIRVGNKVSKCYQLAWFTDAFARYSPPVAEQGGSDPLHRYNTDEMGASGDFQSATKAECSGLGNSEKPNNEGHCSGVADQNGGATEKGKWGRTV